MVKKNKTKKQEKQTALKLKRDEEAEIEREEEKKNKVEINNIQEEIDDILKGCVKCGMCKSLCPVFKTLREESQGPRGRSIMMQERVYDKVLWQCNLCKSCELKCPMGVKVWEAIKKSREVLNLQGKGLESNKEMIKNIRETGNPFGKDPEKSGKLYCC